MSNYRVITGPFIYLLFEEMLRNNDFSKLLESNAIGSNGKTRFDLKEIAKMDNENNKKIFGKKNAKNRFDEEDDDVDNFVKSNRKSNAISDSSYRDRAHERRNEEKLHNETEISSDIVMDKSVLSSLSVEQTKYLGGDIENTHLVKGLDYRLLDKIRKEQSNSTIVTDKVVDIPVALPTAVETSKQNKTSNETTHSGNISTAVVNSLTTNRVQSEVYSSRTVSALGASLKQFLNIQSNIQSKTVVDHSTNTTAINSGSANKQLLKPVTTALTTLFQRMSYNFDVKPNNANYIPTTSILASTISTATVQDIYSEEDRSMNFILDDALLTKLQQCYSKLSMAKKLKKLTEKQVAPSVTSTGIAATSSSSSSMAAAVIKHDSISIFDDVIEKYEPSVDGCPLPIAITSTKQLFQQISNNSLVSKSGSNISSNKAPAESLLAPVKLLLQTIPSDVMQQQQQQHPDAFHLSTANNKNKAESFSAFDTEYDTIQMSRVSV